MEAETLRAVLQTAIIFWLIWRNHCRAVEIDAASARIMRLQYRIDELGKGGRG